MNANAYAPNQSERRLAVLIDGENMPAKFADSILEELAKFGEASVRRVYGDILEGGTQPWLDKLASLAIVPFHQQKASKGKNTADMAIAIDAMDLLHSNRFEGFVIVSSDGDYTKLAQRIREHGTDVFGVGQAKTPEAFRMACKQFITVENLQTEETSGPQKAKKIHHAYQLISNVLAGASDPHGWADLGWLGSQLVQRYPDFDARSYGHRKLSDLVRAIGKFEESGEGSSYKIRQRV